MISAKPRNPWGLGGALIKEPFLVKEKDGSFEKIEEVIYEDK